MNSTGELDLNFDSDVRDLFVPKCKLRVKISVLPQLFTMDPAAAYELITRDLQEVLGGDIIKKILTDGERPVKCYWGM